MIDREKYYYQSRPVCPYCGRQHEPDGDLHGAPVQCYGCGLTYQVEQTVEIHYTSTPLGTCLVCGRLVEIRWRHEVPGTPAHWRCAEHRTPGAAYQCNGSKKGFKPQSEEE